MTEAEKDRARATAVAAAGASVWGAGGATVGVLELAARGALTGYRRVWSLGRVPILEGRLHTESTVSSRNGKADRVTGAVEGKAAAYSGLCEEQR